MGIFANECAHCGSKEHTTEACPQGMFSSACGRCGSKEHATEACPHGMFTSACGRCGSVDHETEACPQGFFSTKCSRCGSKEHDADSCPHGLLSERCDKCGSVDHPTERCPHGLFSRKCEHCGSTKHDEDSCPRLLAVSDQSNRQDRSSSPSEGGGSNAIGWLIGIVVAIIAIVWLLMNVVLPLVLLNAALILTVLALVKKARRTLFAGLAIAGGCYLLVDISNGWLAGNFVNNVVKNPNWLSGFVYVNAMAVGVGAGLLLLPLWTRAKSLRGSERLEDRRRGVLFAAAAVAGVATLAAALPVLYHALPNPFTVSPAGAELPGGEGQSGGKPGPGPSREASDSPMEQPSASLPASSSSGDLAPPIAPAGPAASVVGEREGASEAANPEIGRPEETTRAADPEPSVPSRGLAIPEATSVDPVGVEEAAAPPGDETEADSGAESAPASDAPTVGQDQPDLELSETADRSARGRGTVLDTTAKLMWALQDNGSRIDWEEAHAYCEASQLDGFSDWRLPTIEELRGIYEPSAVASPMQWRPDVDQPRLSIRLSSCCPWSGTQDAKSRNLFFSFAGGKQGRVLISRIDLRLVRALCVRSY